MTGNNEFAIPPPVAFLAPTLKSMTPIKRLTQALQFGIRRELIGYVPPKTDYPNIYIAYVICDSI